MNTGMVLNRTPPDSGTQLNRRRAALPGYNDSNVRNIGGRWDAATRKKALSLAPVLKRAVATSRLYIQFRGWLFDAHTIRRNFVKWEGKWRATSATV